MIQAYTYSNPQLSLQFSHTPMLNSRATCRVLNYETVCTPSTDKVTPFYADVSFTETALTNPQKVAYPDAILLPFGATSIVFTYNLPLIGNSTLVLSAEVLSGIFRKCNDSIPFANCQPGHIKYWNDSKIVALNPTLATELSLSGEVIPVVRDASSGVTLVVKQALAKFHSPYFANQMPIDSSTNWGNASLVNKLSASGEVGYTLTTVGSIGYTPLPRAMFAKVKYAKILRTDSNALATPLEPTVLTTDSAVLELGSIPVVIGEANKASTIDYVTDLFAAVGKTGYPYVQYTYAAIREKTNRKDATSCINRRAVYDFFSWYYTDSAPYIVGDRLGYSIPPLGISKRILKRLEEKYLCNDVPVDIISERGIVNDRAHLRVSLPKGRLYDSLVFAVSKFQDDDDDVDTEVEESTHVIDEAFTHPEENDGHIALLPMVDIDDPEKYAPNNRTDFVSLPFGFVGAGVLFNLCDPLSTVSCPLASASLTLTPDVLVSIMNGDILFWNDPLIQSLNTKITMPNARISVMLPIDFWSDQFSKLFKLYTNREMTYAAGTIQVESEDTANFILKASAYTIGIIPVIDTTLTYANILYNNKETSPSYKSLESCLEDTFDSTISPMFDIKNSNVSTCYRFAIPFHIVANKKFTGRSCEEFSDTFSAKELYEFIKFLYSLSPASFSSGIEAGLTYEEVSKNNPYITSSLYRFLTESVRAMQLQLNFWGIGNALINVGKDLKNQKHIRSEYMKHINQIQCDNETFISSEIFHELNVIPIPVVISISVIAFLIAILCGVTSVWVFYYRKSRLIRNSSPIFLIQILIGSILGLIAVVLAGVDDGRETAFAFDPFEVTGANNDELAILCEATVWLVVLGFAIMMCSLYLKIWRMVTIFNNPRFRRTIYTDYHLLSYEAVVLTVFFAELIIGYYLAPKLYIRVPLTIDEEGNVISSVGFCVTENPFIAYGPVAVTAFIFLVYGNYLSYMSQNIPGEYSEGKYISLSNGFITQAFVFGVPVIAFAGNNPTVGYICKALVIIIVFGVTPAFIFIPKYLIAYGYIESSHSDVLREKRSTNTNSRENVQGEDGSTLNISSKGKKLKSGNNIAGVNMIGSSKPKTLERHGSKHSVSSKSSLYSEKEPQISFRTINLFGKGGTTDNESDEGRKSRSVSVDVSIALPSSSEKVKTEEESRAPEINLSHAEVAPWILMKPPPKKT